MGLVPPRSQEDPTGVLVHLRSQRKAASCSQSELAARVGVSRQAIHAIETGRQVPSTLLALKLARALRCDVEQLFRLSVGTVIDADIPPGASGRVVVGNVGGRWAAHPMTDASAPADGVVVDNMRADGAVEDDTRANSPGRVELLDDASTAATQVLVAGCAPVLGMLTRRLGQRHTDARAAWIPANSDTSVELLSASRVHVGGVHLASHDEPKMHARVALGALPGRTSLVMNLARWRQGLVVAPGNPRGIRGPADLCRSDVRIVHREPGAAAQRLLRRTLAEHGTDIRASPSGLPRALRHEHVAQQVLWGVADVGVAIEASAIAAGLEFLPLAEERFDLLVPQHIAETPAVARFLSQIDHPAFRTETACLPGYDLSTAGHVTTVDGGASP